jgi:hypothetical protein
MLHRGMVQAIKTLKIKIMKKIIMACGLAVAAFGFYSGAFGENKAYVHEDYATISTDMQDTLPGRKRDTANRKPLPQDTVRRDSALVHLSSFVK